MAYLGSKKTMLIGLKGDKAHPLTCSGILSNNSGWCSFEVIRAGKYSAPLDSGFFTGDITVGATFWAINYYMADTHSESPDEITIQACKVTAIADGNFTFEQINTSVNIKGGKGDKGDKGDTGDTGKPLTYGGIIRGSLPASGEVIELSKGGVHGDLTVGAYFFILWETISDGRYLIICKVTEIPESGDIFYAECGSETSIKGDKGDTGAKIVSTELSNVTADGDYVYTQTFSDGTTQTFTAPRGATGSGGGGGVGLIVSQPITKLVFNTQIDTATMADFLASVNYGIATGATGSNDVATLIQVSTWKGVYSLDLSKFGGTGYCIAICSLENFGSTFTVEQIVFVSEYSETNQTIIQNFLSGFTYTAAGWQNATEYILPEDSTITVLATDTDGNSLSGKVSAFIGENAQFWDMLDLCRLRKYRHDIEIKIEISGTNPATGSVCFSVISTKNTPFLYRDLYDSLPTSTDKLSIPASGYRLRSDGSEYYIIYAISLEPISDSGYGSIIYRYHTAGDGAGPQASAFRMSLVLDFDDGRIRDIITPL